MDRHGGRRCRRETGRGRSRIRAAGRSRLTRLAHAGGAQLPRRTRHETVGGRRPCARRCSDVTTEGRDASISLSTARPTRSRTRWRTSRTATPPAVPAVPGDGSSGDRPRSASPNPLACRPSLEDGPRRTTAAAAAGRSPARLARGGRAAGSRRGSRPRVSPEALHTTPRDGPGNSPRHVRGPTVVPRASVVSAARVPTQYGERAEKHDLDRSAGKASAPFQVALIPRYGEYPTTMRARQLERKTADRRPTLTRGAHRVARAPVARQVNGIGRTRDHGPAGRL